MPARPTEFPPARESIIRLCIRVNIPSALHSSHYSAGCASESVIRRLFIRIDNPQALHPSRSGGWVFRRAGAVGRTIIRCSLVGPEWEAGGSRGLLGGSRSPRRVRLGAFAPLSNNEAYCAGNAKCNPRRLCPTRTIQMHPGICGEWCAISCGPAGGRIWFSWRF